MRSSALPGTFGSGSLASWIVTLGSTDSAASETAAVPAAMPGAGCAIRVPMANAMTPMSAADPAATNVVTPAPISMIDADATISTSAHASSRLARPVAPGTM